MSTTENEKEFFHVMYGYGTDANEVSLSIADDMADQWVQAQETNVENVTSFVRHRLDKDQIAELVKILSAEINPSDPSDLIVSIAKHLAVMITFYMPDPDQDHGTAWIESLVPTEAPFMLHVVINEDNVFDHQYGIVGGHKYLIDDLPRELVMEAIEDFSELVTAYDTRTQD